MEYNSIICGGTFDRLHAGHKAFLRFAFTKGEHVTIGITSDKYVHTYKKNREILPFSQREKELQEFLSAEGLLGRATLAAIDTRFDQTQSIAAHSTALLVSEETEKAGKEINAEREAKGLTPLPLLIFPLMQSTEGERVSSTKIREGRIDREGVLLPSKDFLAKTLYVPSHLRSILHKPFGMLFAREIPKQFLKDPEKLVTVGDVTTKKVHDLGIQQKIAVIDFFVERKKTNKTLGELGFLGNEKNIHLINPAGQLLPQVWSVLQEVVEDAAGKENAVIIVDGEEDLFVIPLILILPLGFVIMYGQPQVLRDGPATDLGESGVVILEITEELKRQTFDILKQFVQ